MCAPQPCSVDEIDKEQGDFPTWQGCTMLGAALITRGLQKGGVDIRSNREIGGKTCDDLLGRATGSQRSILRMKSLNSQPAAQAHRGLNSAHNDVAHPITKGEGAIRDTLLSHPSCNGQKGR